MTHALCALVLMAASLGDGFSPIAEDRGVKVYRRERAPTLELGAEGDIAAPPEVVQRVLLDYGSHARWLKDLAESRVLARTPDSLDVYQRLNLPLIDDRDFTLHVTWGTRGVIRWLRFAAANERGPAPMRGVIRVPIHDGSWELEPIDGGRGTHAVYRFRMDLAGSLPKWMVKGRAGKDVTRLFERVRAEVQRLVHAGP